MNKTLLFFLGLLFVFAGAMFVLYASGLLRRDVAREDEGSHASVEVLPVNAESIEFELTDQKGKKFRSESLEGKLWVGSIFFAQCPSTCRIQNMRVAELQQRFADRGVEFVSITCDPENDTPSALNDYAQKFAAKEGKWHFLTGDLNLIKKVGGQKFGITVDDKVHSDRLILFDRNGKLVKTYRSLEADQFAELIAELERRLNDRPESGESPAPEAKPESVPHDSDEEASTSPDAVDPATRDADSPA